jgi:hypothetical protein
MVDPIPVEPNITRIRLMVSGLLGSRPQGHEKPAHRERVGLARIHVGRPLPAHARTSPVRWSALGGLLMGIGTFLG